MHAGATPSWVIRENASHAVLVALYLREVLAIASPVELPRLRGLGPVGERLPTDRQDALERQWRAWWAMTVEPEAHPSEIPLPATGSEELRLAIAGHADGARAWADRAHEQYRSAASARHGDSYRAYAGTIAEHEREVGRRAH